MLSGRQIYLLRTIDTDIKREELAKLLKITYNDVIIYENEKEEIPSEIYEKWIKIIR